ncbi:MAG: biotin-dependent carboxyltransferase family protein [Desulfobacterales bacterium]|nr:biotin-dependent carboxyltransferase family protein [Desulfobacterales bacterium]
MKALKIIQPGPFTTVQDRGRFGFQQFGVPPCGMMDRWAGDIANLLVGNEPDAALIELTVMGGRMEVLDEFDFAVTGADMGLSINGVSCKNWMSHRVAPGDTIQLGPVQTGCRSYLAITGGIDVPVVMNSRSSYIGAKIGGMQGRVIQPNDILERRPQALLKNALALPEDKIPVYPSTITLRAIPGPQDSFFGDGMETFFNCVYTVTPNADRMGYRLEGPVVKRKQGMPKSIISEPSLPGGVQIPEDGQPIILLAEQTVGGYAKIATVISSDLPKLAQAVPGNTIRFEPVTLEQAHRIYRDRHDRFKALETADLGVKTPAAMGKDFFNHPVFRERMEKYMIQI